MFISIVIASKGRPYELEDTISSVMMQDLQPNEIIIVVTDKKDYNESILRHNLVKVYESAPGSSVQRNVGINKTNLQSELIVFLDDDVELASNFLSLVSSYMSLSTWVAGISGTPLLDKPEHGIMSRADARAALLKWQASGKKMPPTIQRGLYGCNMAVRSHYARELLFDERLSFYAWLEDRDFGIRLEKYGQVIDYAGQSIIHFGSRGGRMSEVKLGYAQIMNPAYLFFVKRVFTFGEYIDHGVKGLLANIAGSAPFFRRSERNNLSREIRTKRLRGNAMAIKDIFLHGIRPDMIKSINH